MTPAAYQVRAVNDALTSENRIHSDEVARRFGFTGALVSGVSVFGYLTHPLVEAFGESWLSHTLAEVKFLKPAYVEDVLSISCKPAAARGVSRKFITEVHNGQGTLLATLSSGSPEKLPPVSHLAALAAPPANPPRELIHWDRIVVHQPAARYQFRLSLREHLERLQLLNEKLPLFHLGDCPPLHPYTLLKECNHALMRLFILPAWIHVASEMTFRRVLRVGDEIEVITVPMDKWERKGHQFIKLYIALVADGEVALEVAHSAIFNIASQDDS